jgi:threonylcarbamoyladenosine tRNA methylthiotransferase MtaB
MIPRVAFITIGCKTNFADTVQLRNSLPPGAWDVVGADEPADLIVANSCTVTARADRDLFKQVRRAMEASPGARVVVAGCMAEVYPDRVREALPQAQVLGVSRRPELYRLLGATGAPDWPDEETLASSPRTRAFLKVQEGCDYSCSYCIVPSARGRSRSLDLDRVVELVRAAGERGLGEVVLSGIHLGFYGRDQGPHASLPRLLDRLAGLPRLPRIRLSSIEPNEVDPPLVEALARHPFVARHLHVPLQSGDPGVLARMRRRYPVEVFSQAVERVAGTLGAVGLGTDVLVGFPGEDDAAFENTFRLLESLPLSYLHVFSFSPRPGTPAADFVERVPEEVVRARVKRLRGLSQRLQAGFAAGRVGCTEQVLVEERAPDGRLTGYTGTYLRASFDGGEAWLGRLAAVRLTRARGGALEGRIDGHAG